MLITVRMLFTVIVASLFGGCVPNAAWRTVGEQSCSADNINCNTRFSTEKHGKFDLSFIEFSERGNLFDEKVRDDLLSRVRTDAEAGTVFVVFVHGWKHNANPSDDNVKSFRTALSVLADSDLTKISGAKRKVHGIYVGWRGLSLHGAGSENLTFWDRKATAEEVGRGGLTDLLIQIEALTGDKTVNTNRNVLVVVGHSFGGAMVLSSVNDLLLGRLTNSVQVAYRRIAAFGDAVILLNPAIEANQAFQLKELSEKLGRGQDRGARSLHVISSDGDIATHRLFPVGQWLATRFTWDHATIERHYQGRQILFDEMQMDTVTVGNYDPFRTDVIEAPSLTGGAALDDKEKWIVRSLCGVDSAVGQGPNMARVPCTRSDPVSFVSTSKDFIKDHNDVFNARVIAYIAATASEALYARKGQSFPQCLDDKKEFSFDQCFEHHLADLGQKRIEAVKVRDAL